MIQRKLQNQLLNSLKTFPIVGLLGSRQVGKTTLANMIKKHYTNSIYIDLELPSDLNKLNEPELYLVQHENKLVIIDEIQKKPQLFPLLRALVDKKRLPGRFLLLGSASPDLIKKSSESLAGRIIYHELSPFLLCEVDTNKANDLWLRGGYPESFLSETEENSLIWRDSFISTYLERDISALGIKIPSLQLRRFWTMIAHSQGQLWNAGLIAKSLGVTAPTVRNYLDILEHTFTVRRLVPYHPNIKKRLVKSPKIYFRDTGLLHSLLRINSLESLFSHPIAGNSWEGFVIEQIIFLLPSTWQYYFYRTGAGAEIDLLILTDKNTIIGIEIKFSKSPVISKGFWNAIQDTYCDNAFIVYAGNDFYPIKKNVHMLPLTMIENIKE